MVVFAELNRYSALLVVTFCIIVEFPSVLKDRPLSPSRDRDNGASDDIVLIDDDGQEWPVHAEAGE